MKHSPATRSASTIHPSNRTPEQIRTQVLYIQNCQILFQCGHTKKIHNNPTSHLRCSVFIILRAQISFSSKFQNILWCTAQQTKTFSNHEKIQANIHLSAFHTRKNFLLLAHVCKIKTKSKLHIFLCPKSLFHHLLGVTASFRFWNAPLTASPVCNPPPHLHKAKTVRTQITNQIVFFLKLYSAMSKWYWELDKQNIVYISVY